MYLLDTNVCIKFLNSKSENLHQKIIAQPLSELAICSVVKAELIYGAVKSQKSAENIQKLHSFFAKFNSFDFDDKAAECFGQIRTELESLGTPIGAYDLMIASIALANNLTVVTNNTREFNRVDGLQIEDWEDSI